MTQNISEQLIVFNDKITTFLSSKGLEQEVVIQNAKFENDIKDSKQLKRDLDEINNIDRLLRVGIIGRVKAGKSSLLNALIFDGKDILPKAATPMTAALTRMEYSEEIRAEVEFYDQTDLDQIAGNSSKYEQMFQNIKSARLSELEKENEANKKSPHSTRVFSRSEMEEIAENYAYSEADKFIELSSAYTQNRLIQQTQVQLSELKAHAKIQANSIEDLMGKLNDYVGASGKFMPFTKSVKLYIPEEGLKGLEIVDTPGVNDPVQSREERTNAFLAQCDVVLVVSPSGQFLSQEDMDLMGRVTEINGIQEAYIIASQADNQLFGSEKNGDFDPISVLNRVTDKLSNHAHKVLSDSQAPIMQRVLELYQKHSVICTSSVAATMARTLDAQQNWDENIRHVWVNLKQHYPDCFVDLENAKIVLETLSNVKCIKDILEEVKVKKASIKVNKQNNLVLAKVKAYRAFLAIVGEFIEERIDDIQTKDIDSERLLLSNFEELRDEYEEFIDTEYRKVTRKFNQQKYQLFSKLDLATKGFTKMNEVVAKDEEEYFQDYEYSDSEFMGLLKNLCGQQREKRHFQNHRTVRRNEVNAGQVNQFISEVRDKIAIQLSEEADELQSNWQDDFIKLILNGMKEIHNQYQPSERFERRFINSTIQNVFSNMPKAHFSIQDTMPKNLKKYGLLKDLEAITFAQEAHDYMYDKLKPGIRNDIQQFIEESIDTLNQQPISKLILGKLGKQIDQLIYAIENKEESIARYRRMQSDLNKLQTEIPNA